MFDRSTVLRLTREAYSAQPGTARSRATRAAFDELLRQLHRENMAASWRPLNWRRIHRLFAMGRNLQELTGMSAPISSIVIDGLRVSCDGMTVRHSSGFGPLLVPFDVRTRAPMLAVRKHVGRASDMGPGALLPVFEPVGWRSEAQIAPMIPTQRKRGDRAR